MRTSQSLWMALSLTALVGCATSGRPTGTPLEDTDWRLVELNGRPAIATGGERGAHLRFARDSARVAGSTGCNRLTGSFSLQGTALRFGPTATTRMACVDAQLNEQERALLAALQATERYGIAGDTLTLMGTSGALARFAASP